MLHVLLTVVVRQLMDAPADAAKRHEQRARQHQVDHTVRSAPDTRRRENVSDGMVARNKSRAAMTRASVYTGRQTRAQNAEEWGEGGRGMADGGRTFQPGR